MGFTIKNSMHQLNPTQCDIVYVQYSEIIPAYTWESPIMKYFHSISNEGRMPRIVLFQSDS